MFAIAKANVRENFIFVLAIDKDNCVTIKYNN